MAYTDDLMVDKAKQVNTNLVVKLNGGTTEGTNLFTYNGSAGKSINITASSIGAAASSHNHSAANITSGTLPVSRGGTGATSIGRGLSVSSNQLGHSNSAITAGNGGPTANSTVSAGGSFTVPYISYDSYGHITGRTNRTITLNGNILDTGDIVTNISNVTVDELSDTTVASAKLLKHEVDAIYQHWSYAFNNSASSRTCYIMLGGNFAGSMNRGSLLIFLTGNSNDICCCRHIKFADYSSEPMQSTMYQGSGGAGWNGNKYVNSSGGIVNSVTQAEGIALTNVTPYAFLDIYATGSVWIHQSYF